MPRSGELLELGVPSLLCVCVGGEILIYLHIVRVVLLITNLVSACKFDLVPDKFNISVFKAEFINKNEMK